MIVNSLRAAAPAEAGIRQRVLVVAPEPFYEDRGTPIAVLQVLHALSELGQEVDVLTYPIGSSPGIPGVTYHRIANPFRYATVPVGLSARKIVLDALLVVRLLRLLRARSYAVIHAVEEAAFPAVFLGGRLRLPVIYDMQSSLPEQMAKYSVFRGQRVQRVLRRCEKWLLQRADLVMSSAGLGQQVRTIAPGVPVEEWAYVSSAASTGEDVVRALRERLNIPATSQVVVYTGNFEGYQGLPALVEALPYVQAAVPGVVLVLVGAEGRGSDAIAQQAARLNLNGHIRLVERQDRASMPAFLALANVLVSPRSYGANLPLKIFDYLAAGRPIVATDIPTHRAVLNEERALLVPPFPAAIGAALSRILQDQALADRLSAAARDYAATHLGWPSFVRSVAVAYRQVGVGAD